MIRVIAVFSVLSVHFFLHNGFYEEIVVGKRLFFMGTMRNFFMICVPLFLILTGFLMNKKVVSRKYYSGLKKTYITYVLASIACLVYFSISTQRSFGIIESIKMILNFSAAPYSWYIEMYIGLFLLIPLVRSFKSAIPEIKKTKNRINYYNVKFNSIAKCDEYLGNFKENSGNTIARRK